MLVRNECLDLVSAFVPCIPLLYVGCTDFKNESGGTRAATAFLLGRSDRLFCYVLY